MYAYPGLDRSGHEGHRWTQFAHRDGFNLAIEQDAFVRDARIQRLPVHDLVRQQREDRRESALSIHNKRQYIRTM